MPLHNLGGRVSKPRSGPLGLIAKMGSKFVALLPKLLKTIKVGKIALAVRARHPDHARDPRVRPPLDDEALQDEDEGNVPDPLPGSSGRRRRGFPEQAHRDHRGHRRPPHGRRTCGGERSRVSGDRERLLCRDRELDGAHQPVQPAARVTTRWWPGHQVRHVLDQLTSRPGHHDRRIAVRSSAGRSGGPGDLHDHHPAWGRRPDHRASFGQEGRGNSRKLQQDDARAERNGNAASNQARHERSRNAAGVRRLRRTRRLPLGLHAHHGARTRCRRCHAGPPGITRPH